MLELPDELSAEHRDRFERAERFIDQLVACDSFVGATIEYCGVSEAWRVEARLSEQGATYSPREDLTDAEDRDCDWRLELVLRPPVDFGLLVQAVVVFSDANVFLPEIAVNQGRCSAIQAESDLDLVLICRL